MEGEENGWHAVSRDLICDRCFADEYLKDFIRENGAPGTCAYCDAEGEEIRCLPFDEVMELIGEAVNWLYGNADNEGMPYESGEAVFPESEMATWDVVDDIQLEVSERVLDDILAALPDQNWCRRGRLFSLSKEEVLRFGWQGLVEKVKYETRYLFTLPDRKVPAVTESVALLPDPAGAQTHNRLKLQPTWEDGGGAEIDDDSEDIPAHRMLDAIGDVVTRFDLVQVRLPGVIFFRVRVDDASKSHATAADLGPPPREKATRANRMSPAGIVMFYGAFDRKTAIWETWDFKQTVWIAQFRSLRALRLLDLSQLPGIPSIYDQDHREEIAELTFLHDFVEDLVKPIEQDGREHIDYVPTQVVTEYFRHRFRMKEGEPLDGICEILPSSLGQSASKSVLSVSWEIGFVAALFKLSASFRTPSASTFSA